MAQIVDALRQTGELDDTILVFSSDNGTFQGQHRIPGGKGLAYEEAAHLPLAVRVPPKYAGGPHAAADDQRDDGEHRLRADVPRLGRFRQAAPEVGDCRVMDGRSWLPLFDPKAGRLSADRPLATELR